MNFNQSFIFLSILKLELNVFYNSSCTIKMISLCVCIFDMILAAMIYKNSAACGMWPWQDIGPNNVGLSPLFNEPIDTVSHIKPSVERIYIVGYGLHLKRSHTCSQAWHWRGRYCGFLCWKSCPPLRSCLSFHCPSKNESLAFWTSLFF